MTLFLASVRGPLEAQTVLDAGADIVDLKDPSKGALGAVAPSTIAACIAAIGGRAPVSATVGDLPMEPDIVTAAVAATADLGVNHVKLGIMPGGDPLACLTALADRKMSAGLILVFFADAMPDFDPIEAAQSCHAGGVMLDTADKTNGALPDTMSFEAIGQFIARARRHALISGVAGSLKASHVPALLALAPDVVGFRGGLCCDGGRTEALDPDACRTIRALIPCQRASGQEPLRERVAPALC